MSVATACRLPAPSPFTSPRPPPIRLVINAVVAAARKRNPTGCRRRVETLKIKRHNTRARRRLFDFFLNFFFPPATRDIYIGHDLTERCGFFSLSFFPSSDALVVYGIAAVVIRPWYARVRIKTCLCSTGNPRTRSKRTRPRTGTTNTTNKWNKTWCSTANRPRAVPRDWCPTSPTSASSTRGWPTATTFPRTKWVSLFSVHDYPGAPPEEHARFARSLFSRSSIRASFIVQIDKRGFPVPFVVVSFTVVPRRRPRSLGFRVIRVFVNTVGCPTCVHDVVRHVIFFFFYKNWHLWVSGPEDDHATSSTAAERTNTVPVKGTPKSLAITRVDYPPAVVRHNNPNNNNNMRFSPIGKHWEIYEFKITFRHTFVRHQQQYTRTPVIVYAYTYRVY